MLKAHSFHIPVMGTGFSIDTPLKVSHLGISSVISLIDDVLLEKLRKMYCNTFNLPYDEITEKDEDFKAKRISSYLNLINNLVDKKIEDLKNNFHEKSQDIKDYFENLPDLSSLKQEYKDLQHKFPNFNELIYRLKDHLVKGDIDVNIMTKVDKTNYLKGKPLPVEYNDAHAALRGFAQSNLNSSVVLSAGMNTRLYAYLESFDDFYPDKNGEFKKKIILKVSDYKSALIQGKYLAKRGLWVSEFRVESGLNCGGHAFATDGMLMGPILYEFKARRTELIDSMKTLYFKALTEKNKFVEDFNPKLKFTFQGGVGTSEEHEFLLEKFELDSIGWGSPFLLVPEVTNVDVITRKKLSDAREDDLYLSNISPLGVPFNSLRGNTKDIEKQELINSGKPGSTCPRKYLQLNSELTSRTICTASRTYQNLKIKALDKLNISDEKYQNQYNKIVDKSCICAGLGTSALLVNKIDFSDVGPGVSICPGPNMAYFSKTVSLKEMIGHIYGRNNVILRPDRPNVFIKELNLYIDYLKNKIQEAHLDKSIKSLKPLSFFANNLMDGVSYYREMFSEVKNKFQNMKTTVFNDLEKAKFSIEELLTEIQNLSMKPVKVDKQQTFVGR